MFQKQLVDQQEVQTLFSQVQEVLKKAEHQVDISVKECDKPNIEQLVFFMSKATEHMGMHPDGVNMTVQQYGDLADIKRCMERNIKQSEVYHALND